MTSELTRRGESKVNVAFPGYEGVLDAQHAGRTLLEQMQAPSHEAPATEERFWRTLSLLVPDSLSPERMHDLTVLNGTLREEMKNASRRLLSPRGDDVEIIDEQLRELGFRSVLYKMNPKNKREANITLRMGDGQHEFVARLDEYFGLRNSETGEALTLATHGAFLEHVLLSHMHEIRCADGQTETGTEKGPSTGRTVGARRAHRRILAEGWNPTAEQIATILLEYDIDLVRWNREREARGETQKVTYVMERKGSDEQPTPVHSRPVSATKKLHEILEGAMQ